MRICNRKAARFEIGRLRCLVSAFFGGTAGIARCWHFAHTPPNLTSPAPELAPKHPDYRSIFWLMRMAAKPENLCGTTALSHFRLLHIPLDGFHAHGADGGDDVVVVLPVGAADQRGRYAGGGADALVAGGDVVDDLLRGQAVVVVVVVGVAHDLVPCVVERLDGFRILLRPVAHHEKCGLDVVLRQNIDQRLGVLVAPR